ncbi:MAG: hypothetical protein E7624_02455 [Ruminococcaceae bacterium]|nr:hypothetical protein [Oscillospiraceae bacterium]
MKKKWTTAKLIMTALLAVLLLLCCALGMLSCGDSSSKELAALQEELSSLQAELEALEQAGEVGSAYAETLQDEITRLETLVQGLRACLKGEHSYGTWSGNAEGTHKRTCVYCAASDEGTCDYGDWSGNGDHTHTRVCKTCSFSVSADCAYSCTDNRDQTHNAVCVTCAQTATLACEFDNGFCKKCDGYEKPDVNADGAYALGNAGELYWFARHVSEATTVEGSTVDAVLTADITVNENVLNENYELTENVASLRVWIPIQIYAGRFDGKGHSISGLYCDDATAKNVGLFGTLAYTSRREENDLQGIHVKDSFFCGKENVGGLAGDGFNLDNAGWKVVDCSFDGVCVGTNYVGGIIGNIESSSSLTNCHASGRILGNTYVGGIIGGTKAKTLEAELCTFTGSVLLDTTAGAVSLSGGGIGGICGGTRGDGITIFQCAVIGHVGLPEEYDIKVHFEDKDLSHDSWFAYYIGGIVGHAATFRVARCTFTGTVKGGMRVGGIAGSFTKMPLNTSNHVKGNVIGIDAVGGICGAMLSSEIASSTFEGDVSGREHVGGILGLSLTPDNRIINCLMVGAVSHEGEYAGVVHTDYESGYSDYKNILSENNYYLLTAGEAKVTQGCTAVTQAQLASGEVCYRLGNNFGQELGVDSLPTPTKSEYKVYYVPVCDGTEIKTIYTNTPTREGHTVTDGRCECGVGTEEV